VNVLSTPSTFSFGECTTASELCFHKHNALRKYPRNACLILACYKEEVIRKLAEMLIFLAILPESFIQCKDLEKKSTQSVLLYGQVVEHVTFSSNGVSFASYKGDVVHKAEVKKKESLRYFFLLCTKLEVIQCNKPICFLFMDTLAMNY